MLPKVLSVGSILLIHPMAEFPVPSKHRGNFHASGNFLVVFFHRRHRSVGLGNSATGRIDGVLQVVVVHSQLLVRRGRSTRGHCIIDIHVNGISTTHLGGTGGVPTDGFHLVTLSTPDDRVEK